MVIRWSHFAKQSLKEIFDFYSPSIGKDHAKKIATDLINETLRLKSFPNLGKTGTG